MKFLAVRDPGDGRVRLIKQYPGGRSIEVLPAQSLKVWNHSPSGFEMGYGGSGPAQLALATLLAAGLGRDRAIRLHQAFKWRFVAQARGGFMLSRFAILEWAENEEGVATKEQPS